jgi:ATP-dependent RNA helicase RhlE
MPTAQAVSVDGFAQFNLHPQLRRGLAAAGYTAPRSIQEHAIPSALAGRDVLGLAQTGTGKTAAFALPVLQRLLCGHRRGPHALVIAPTRELTLQIDAEIRMLATFTRLKTVTIYGGISDRPQIRTLRRHPDIIVACPGRLLDLFERGEVCLDRIKALVLDEADHMFDMGFLPDIRRILAALPEKRQNLLFAATMPNELRRLTEQVLQDPDVAELAHSAPPALIEHALCGVQQNRKMALLRYLLSDADFVSAIVFTRTKHRAKKLALQLGKKGHRAVALQGNMSQAQRDHAMRGFRGRRFDILVATDIAARGIDVDRVSHVINFDVPDSPEAYTHRIGRTGRTERAGKACTFVTEDDRNVVRVIERTMGTSIPRLMIDGFEGTFPVPPTRQKPPSVGRYPRKGAARRNNKRCPREVRRLRRRK